MNRLDWKCLKKSNTLAYLTNKVTVILLPVKGVIVWPVTNRKYCKYFVEVEHASLFDKGSVRGYKIGLLKNVFDDEILIEIKIGLNQTSKKLNWLKSKEARQFLFRIF